MDKYKLLQIMEENGVIEQEDRDIYECGLNTIVSTTIMIACIITFALFYNCVLPTILYFATFIFVRSYTGGYHSNTHKGCLIISVTTYMFCMLAGSLLLIYDEYRFITLALGLVCLLVLGSNGMLPSKTRQFSEAHIIKCEKRLKYIIIVMTLFIFLDCIFLKSNYGTYIVSALVNITVAYIFEK